jgi:hypothetical protein
MKRRLIPVMGLAALVLAVVLTAGTLTMTPSMANEDNGFTERSLEGNWGILSRGVVLVDDKQIPTVVVGPFSFDGKGECSHSFTGNVGGETFAGTVEECTYEVNSDGTGSITFSFEGQEETFKFVLVDDANEFHFIVLGQAVDSGVAKRQ